MNTASRLVLWTALCSIVAGPACGLGTGQYIVLQSHLLPDLKRVTIRLEGTLTGRDQGPIARRRTAFETENIPPRFTSGRVGAASYVQYVNLGAVGGRIYHAFARPTDISKCLARNVPEMIDVLIVSEPAPGGDVPKKELEGWLTLGNEVQVPVQEQISPVGSNGLRDLQATIALTVSSRSGRRVGGSVEVRSQLSAQGSQILGSTKLSVTVGPIVDVPAAPDQPWSASLSPVAAGSPPQFASGTLADPLTLGPAKIVAEKVAKDLSEIVVAVLDGDLDTWQTEPKRRIETLPDFARVEFFGRRLLTRDDLLSAAAVSGHVVLVFADLAGTNNPFMGGPASRPSALTLGIRPLIDTLGRDLDSPPPTVLVVRQVNLRELFEEYLDKQPPYLMLSDYADSMACQFVGTSGPNFMPFYPDQRGRDSLRGALGIADNSVAVVIVDKTGAIRSFNDDAGGNLREALLAANKVLRGE